jgi:hypothetical protein
MDINESSSSLGHAWVEYVEACFDRAEKMALLLPRARCLLVGMRGLARSAFWVAGTIKYSIKELCDALAVTR